MLLSAIVDREWAQFLEKRSWAYFVMRRRSAQRTRRTLRGTCRTSQTILTSRRWNEKCALWAENQEDARAVRPYSR